MRQPSTTTRRRTLRDRLREEDGYAGTAIAYPAVIVLCLALFQFGLFYVASNTAQAAAETAYQQARAYRATPADGVAAGRELLGPGALLRDGNVTITGTKMLLGFSESVTVFGKIIDLNPKSPSDNVRPGLSGRDGGDSRRVLKPHLDVPCGPRPLAGSIAVRACATKPT